MDIHFKSENELNQMNAQELEDYNVALGNQLDLIRDYRRLVNRYHTEAIRRALIIQSTGDVTVQVEPLIGKLNNG